MTRFRRIIGLLFIIIGLSVAAALAIALISSAALDCSINWYAFDCPDWLGPFAAVGTFWIVPGLVLALVGILIRPRA